MLTFVRKKLIFIITLVIQEMYVKYEKKGQGPKHPNEMFNSTKSNLKYNVSN